MSRYGFRFPRMKSLGGIPAGRAFREWMEAPFGEHPEVTLGRFTMPPVQGEEFVIEFEGPPESMKMVGDNLEAEFVIGAVWLVDPRSKGMIADDEVTAFWRFLGFPCG